MSVVAILLSDIHLTLKKPRCRHQEVDWLEVQRRQLAEVRELAKVHDCPVLCGGDIFDRWNVPPELIGFALNELPDGMISVAGNHDLPYHSLEEMNRSAFGVLVTAGKIRLADPLGIMADSSLRVHGFSWGQDISPLSRKEDDCAHVLLAHKYVCSDKTTGYVGVSDSEKYAQWKKLFATYDAVHLGDNHTYWKRGTCFNPGSFYRRTVDDKAPVVGLLHKNGKRFRVDPSPLKTAELDVIDYDVKEAVKFTPNEEVAEFIQSLRHSSESKLNYTTALKEFIKKEKTPESVSDLLLQAVEGVG